MSYKLPKLEEIYDKIESEQSVPMSQEDGYQWGLDYLKDIEKQLQKLEKKGHSIARPSYVDFTDSTRSYYLIVYMWVSTDHVEAGWGMAAARGRSVPDGGGDHDPLTRRVGRCGFYDSIGGLSGSHFEPRSWSRVRCT